MSFIDMTPDKWYYKDITELLDIVVEGKPFYSSFNYNVFREGRESVDVDLVANVQGQYEFYVSGTIHPSESNPLTVFVDDIAATVDEVIPNESSNQTYIKLARGVGAGSVVRVFYAGEPEIEVVSLTENTPIRISATENGSIIRSLGYMDRVRFIELVDNWYKIWDSASGSEGYIRSSKYVRTTPAVVNPVGVEYPSASLIIEPGYSYVYDMFEGLSTEQVRVNGKQLRKVMKIEDLEFEDDYFISLGKIYTNYSLNGKLLDVEFLVRNWQGILKTKYQRLRVRSPKIIYNNYFFPNFLTSRAEVITTLNKLRMYTLKKYTDSPPWRSPKVFSRFVDVNEILVTGTVPWWWENVRDYEDMKMPDGEYLLTGITDDILGADANITRAEMADLIDKTRIWLLEAIK